MGFVDIFSPIDIENHLGICGTHSPQGGFEVLIEPLYLSIGLGMESRAQADLDPKGFAELCLKGHNKLGSRVRDYVCRKAM